MMPICTGLSYYSQKFKTFFFGLIFLMLCLSGIAQEMNLDVSYVFISEKDWDPNDNNKVVMGEDVEIVLSVSNERRGARLAFQWDFGGGDTRLFGNATETEIKAFGNFAACSREYEFTVSVQDSVAYQINDSTTVDSFVVVSKVFSVEVLRRPNPILWDVNKSRFLQFSNCQDFDLSNPTYEVETRNDTDDDCAVDGTYNIDWGDGSVEQNLSEDSNIPIHTFTEIRAYDIFIEVDGTNGLIGRSEYQVKNESNPPAGFETIGNTVGCSPIEANFAINLSEIVKNSPNNTYIWNFDDDTEPVIWQYEDLIANDGKIEHVFTEPTYYFSENGQIARRNTVSLTALNSCDNTPISTPSVKVGGGPESMFVLEDSIFCVGKPIIFNNQTLLGVGYDRNTENTLYWDFGDGSPEQTVVMNDPSEVVPVPHTYDSPGTYVVSLKSENQCTENLELSAFKDTIVVEPFPVAEFSVTADADICGITSLSVVNVSENFIVEEGSGSYWEVETLSGGGKWRFERGDLWSIEPVFSFDTAGIYNITYYAVSKCDVDAYDTTIVIKDIPVIGGDIESMACKNGVFSTEELVVDPNFGVIQHVRWEANDPTVFIVNADSVYPEITFTELGNYKLTLTAENECGIATKEIDVEVVETPVANAVVSSLVGIPGHKVDFTINSTGGNLTHTYLIDKPGARFESLGGNEGDTAIVFNDAGNFLVRYIASNYCDADTVTFTVRINDKPGVNFTPIVFKCDSFVFTGNDWVGFSYSAEETIDSLLWTVTPDTGFVFLDGTDSLSDNPIIHFKETNRAYKIEVGFSTNLYKGIIRDSSEFFLYESPAIDFFKDKDTLCINDTLSLIDASLGDALDYTWEVKKILPNNADSWSFSKTTETAYDTSLVFSEWGTYVVSLTIENPCGRLTKTDTVIVQDNPVENVLFPATLCLDPSNEMEISIADFYTINWNHNDQDILWTIEPITNGKVVYVNGTSGRSVYPQVLIQGSGVYRISRTYSTTCFGVISESVDVEVFSAPPPSEFSVNTNLGCAPFVPVLEVDTALYLQYERENIPLNYKWDFGNGDSLMSLMPPTDLVLTQGLNDTVYNVKFIVGNVCFSDTFNILITVLPKPTAQFELMHEWECSPVEVRIKNLTEGSPDDYFWDFGDGFTSIKKEPKHTLTAENKPISYTITLATGNLCGVDTLKKEIIIKPQTVDAYFSIDKRLVCAGTPVTFRNFSTDTSFFIRKNFWEFGDGNVDTSTYETTHIYQEPGKYYVKLTVNNFCGIDTIIDSIVVEPSPIVEILSPDTICSNVPVEFTVASDINLGAYSWDFGDGDSSRLTKPEHLFLEEGTYAINLGVVSSRGVAGCASKASKTITINPSPNDQIFPDDTSFCSPFVYKPKAVGIGGYHLWNFGVDSSYSVDPLFTYDNKSARIRKYTVTLITENDYGCSYADAASVSVLPRPEATIDSAIVGESPRELHLFNVTQNAVNCIWIYENGDSIQSCDDQVRYFSQNGQYNIKLVTLNQYGCNDADSISYEPGLNKGLFFPNAFAPNLDDENARVFKAYGIGVKEYELKVYDRWNNVVWSSSLVENTEPSDSWNGNDQSGKPLPHGVYYWVCRAKMFGKENEPDDAYNGTVYLIR